MKIVYVRNGCIPYADALVKGYKAMETRSRNTLKSLVGEPVLIARTSANRKTEIIGKLTFCEPIKMNYAEFRRAFNKHLVPPDSMFDCKRDGFKWCYPVKDWECFEHPVPMPTEVIRHGFTWCELA